MKAQGGKDFLEGGVVDGGDVVNVLEIGGGQTRPAGLPEILRPHVVDVFPTGGFVEKKDLLGNLAIGDLFQDDVGRGAGLPGKVAKIAEFQVDAVVLAAPVVAGQIFGHGDKFVGVGQAHDAVLDEGRPGFGRTEDIGPGKIALDVGHGHQMEFFEPLEDGVDLDLAQSRMSLMVRERSA